MTDNQTIHADVAIVTEPTTTEAAIARIEEASLETQLAYAVKWAESGMVPEHFRKKPENILVAMQWGRELGLTPMAAMNEIYVVHGSPSLSAKSMQMLAQRAGHRVRTTGDAQQATCEIVRADDPDFAHRVTYTLDDARQAGLMGNTGWKSQPKVMLRYRAIATCVRLACPEVLGGISYLPEEVEEIARRNRAVPHVQVINAKADPSRSAGDYMKRLGITGAAMKEFSARVLGKPAPAWGKLSESEQGQILDGLAQWEATGHDWTLAETVDAELIDPETGEVA